MVIYLDELTMQMLVLLSIGWAQPSHGIMDCLNLATNIIIPSTVGDGAKVEPKAWSKPINRVDQAAYRHDL